MKKMFVSVNAVTWVFQESKSEGAARLVLLVIASHCNHDGYCWPSLDTIMQCSNLSKPTCIKAIDSLETKYREIVVQRGGQGPGSTNCYYMNAFMERVNKGKVEEDRGKPDDEKGLRRIDQNKKSLEEVEKEENKPLSNEQKDYKKIEQDNADLQARKSRRNARKEFTRRGWKPPIQLNTPVATPEKRDVRRVNKHPESWTWFATVFTRLGDKAPFDGPEMWPLVDEMLESIFKEEAEERLSIYLDSQDRVTAFSAKSFLEGGWKTIDPADYKMPQIEVPE